MPQIARGWKHKRIATSTTSAPAGMAQVGAVVLRAGSCAGQDEGRQAISSRHYTCCRGWWTTNCNRGREHTVALAVLV